MPEAVRSLDRLTIPKPCDADWDSMIGNDQVRFCGHCNLHVTNLSTMTRQDAMRLVARSRGRLCVRYIQRPGGGVLTKTPEKLYRIGRRVSRIAAGAFTATLSLSSAAAQTSSSPNPDRLRQVVNAEQLISAQAIGATLSGVVSDQNGAVVSGATVTLADNKRSLAFTFTTSDDGAYKFSFLEAGTYNLTAEAPSFAKKEMLELGVQADRARIVNVTMEIPQVLEEVEINAGTITVVQTVNGGAMVARPEQPLVKAAYENDLNAVKQLAFTQDVNVIDEPTNETALAYAIENGNREMVGFLLAAGADIHARNRDGQTALMHLHSKATVDLVRDLIRAGADVNAVNDSGDTPLFLAAYASSAEVINELMVNGASVQAHDNDGVTVLMKAAENEDSNVIKLLLRAGVDVNAKSSNKETALMIAAKWGRPATLQALINVGADIEAKDDADKTALNLAAGNDDPQLAKVLIDAGADVNATDKDGMTALMNAASDGMPATIKSLIDAGANINAKDKDGSTALMVAKDFDNTQVLLMAGADINEKDKDGSTALSIARKANQDDIVKLLLAHGARE
jgi:ankyrin repeat protein